MLPTVRDTTDLEENCGGKLLELPELSEMRDSCLHAEVSAGGESSSEGGLEKTSRLRKLQAMP